MIVTGELQTQLDSRDVERWLIARLARTLNVEADEIDLRAPVLRYGLDSVESVRISAELEGWLGFRLDKLLLEFPDVVSYLAYVADEIARRGGRP